MTATGSSEDGIVHDFMHEVLAMRAAEATVAACITTVVHDLLQTCLVVPDLFHDHIACLRASTRWHGCRSLSADHQQGLVRRGDCLRCGITSAMVKR